MVSMNVVSAPSSLSDLCAFFGMDAKLSDLVGTGSARVAAKPAPVVTAPVAPIAVAEAPKAEAQPDVVKNVFRAIVAAVLGQGEADRKLRELSGMRGEIRLREAQHRMKEQYRSVYLMPR